ncbi:MAG: hypothetical protein IKV43_04400 [Clostridia bacterium]|nr:hypothetical protein [Clostridia bacterium]
MYTRAYPDRTSEIPDGYNGTAMSDSERVDTGYIPTGANPWEGRVGGDNDTDGAVETGGVASSIFGGLFQNGRFSLQSIGFEEILILAVAAYMLMSQEGDRMCGIMLLVLLFIS